MIDQLYQRQGLVVFSFSSVSLPGMLNYSSSSIAAAKLRHQLLSSEKKNHLPASYSRKHHFRSRNNELSKVSRGHSPGRGQYHDQQWHKNYGVTPGRNKWFGVQKKCPDSSGAVFYLFPKSAMIRPNFLKYVGLWTISTSWGWGGCGKSPLSNIFQLIWNGKM